LRFSKNNILKFIIGASLIATPFLDNWYSTIRFEEDSLLSPLQIIRGGTLILLIGVLGSALKKVKIRKLMLWPLLWIMFILVVLAIPQSSVGGNLVEVFRLAYISVFLFCGYYISQYDDEVENWLYKIGLVMLVGIIGLQIYGYSIGSTFYRSEFAMVGLGDRPSVTAQGLNVVILLLLIKIREYKIKHWVILAVAFASLTFTLRRGSLIGSVLSLLAIITVLMLYDKKTMKNIRLAFSFTSFLVVGIFIVINSPIYTDLLTRLQEINIAVGGTGSGRLVFWSAAISSGIDRAIINIISGEGMGNILNAIGRNYHRPIGAHNIWLQYFLGVGMIGLMLLLYWHFKLINLFRKVNISQKPILVAISTSIIFLGFTDGSVFNPTWAAAYFLIGSVIQRSNEENI